MNPEFWQQRWQENDIGFHEDQYNPQLLEHFHMLELGASSQVFVPLCGKTRDIQWLLNEDYQVVAVELYEDAVKQLFIALGLTPKVSHEGALKHYQAENISVFSGDIFNLEKQSLGKVDATYDRAAMIALPDEMRKNYCQHLIKLTDAAPQLLLCYEYPQEEMSGPPFSIGHQQVLFQYQENYDITLLASQLSPEKLKGSCYAQALVWMLTPLK